MIATDAVFSVLARLCEAHRVPASRQALWGLAQRVSERAEYYALLAELVGQPGAKRINWRKITAKQARNALNENKGLSKAHWDKLNEIAKNWTPKR